MQCCVRLCRLPNFQWVREALKDEWFRVIAIVSVRPIADQVAESVDIFRRHRDDQVTPIVVKNNRAAPEV
jgi:hypothetical protein